jgi:hypothetical protein
VYLEQAYLNYRFKDWLQMRAGLVLIPMGIINENHEPPTFNGVMRPSVDYYVIPTTWREIGFGFTGRIQKASLNYKIYIVNGVVGYDGAATLNGEFGIRKGRQKGIASIIGSPSFTGRLEFSGIRNLQVGVSGFAGATQTTLNRSLSKDDQAGIDARDSSIVEMSMFDVDAQYNIAGFSFRTLYTFASFSNTAAYDEFTGSNLGKSMMGFYLEAAYNVLYLVKSTNHQLISFVRYENFNTQQNVDDPAKQNDAYHREEIIFGLGWKPIPNVALKADYQMIRPKSESTFTGIINIGVGLMF